MNGQLQSCSDCLSCTPQVREYKADLATLQESSKAAAGAASGGASARAELGLSDDYRQTSAGQRDRLLQTTEKMSRTGERITQGRQQLLETEVSMLFSCFKLYMLRSEFAYATLAHLCQMPYKNRGEAYRVPT